MIHMREFNYLANFVIFIAPIWALLSPRIPVKFIGHAVLFVLSMSAIWNIEVTNTLQLSISGLLTKCSVACVCIWMFWHIEHEHLKLYFWPLTEHLKKWFWWLR